MTNLYKITITRTIFVVAEDNNDEEEITSMAIDGEFSEVSQGNNPDNISIEAVTELLQIPSSWLTGVPYDKNKNTERTVRDWFEKTRH